MLLLLAHFGHQSVPGQPSDTGLWPTSNTNVGEYERQIGLSPPVVYPSTMGIEENKDSF
jgi:hypothetical protein